MRELLRAFSFLFFSFHFYFKLFARTTAAGSVTVFFGIRTGLKMPWFPGIADAQSPVVSHSRRAFSFRTQKHGLKVPRDSSKTLLPVQVLTAFPRVALSFSDHPYVPNVAFLYCTFLCVPWGQA